VNPDRRLQAVEAIQSVVWEARQEVAQKMIGWCLIASMLASAAFFALGTRSRHLDGTFDVQAASVYVPFQVFAAVLCVALGVLSVWSINGVSRTSAQCASALVILFLASSHFQFTDIVPRDYMALFLGVTCIILGKSPTQKMALLAAWLFMIVNFAAMVFKPKSVFYATYDTTSLSHQLTLLNLPIRLFGSEVHPNALAFVAGTLLIIAILSKPRGLRWLLVAGLMIIIILTQSKTTVAGLLIAGFATRMRWRPGFWLPVLLLSLSVSYIYIVEGLGPSAPGVDLSLTGRTVFWHLLSSAFMESPIFGYGPTGITEALAGSTSGAYAAATDNAHNVVWQTLITGGLFGLFGFVVFMSSAWKVTRQSQVASAILLFAVIRGMAEGPTPATSTWLWVVAFLFYNPPVEVFKPKIRKSIFRRGRKKVDDSESAAAESGGLPTDASTI